MIMWFVKKILPWLVLAWVWGTVIDTFHLSAEIYVPVGLLVGIVIGYFEAHFGPWMWRLRHPRQYRRAMDHMVNLSDDE